jgi:hypothetical protein
MRFQKYKPGSLVLLRRLDSSGQVATTWGGRILRSSPTELSVLASEMVYRDNAWHSLGNFREITAPPHRVPYNWDFPRLLVQFEANPVDLEAAPVLERALEAYRQAQDQAPADGSPG